MAQDKGAKLKQDLNKRLVKLQGESAVVQSIIAKTNQLEYENLSAIYLWWRAAATIQGYLDEAYKPTLLRRVFNDANDGTNFRRLLYLMYGNYGIDKDSLDRKNRVLCKLHEEYKKHPALYLKNGVSKLAGFIKAQGGVDGLINAAQQMPVEQLETSKDSATTSNTPSVQRQVKRPKFIPRIEVKITDAMRQTALSGEAAKYFADYKSTHKVAIKPPITTNKDGYGLALFRRKPSGYEVIGDTDNPQAIRELMVTAFRRQFAALPQSTRCLFEIIKTQSLPPNLLKLYDKLAELSVEKHDDGTRRKITRRLMYVASEKLLVLSPTYSKSGVVTLAKTKRSPFEKATSDIFMPTRCRKIIEQRMLAPQDFNLFSASSAKHVPRFNREGLASHLLRLNNKADAGDFVFLEFWHFEDEMGLAKEQLFFAPSYAKSCPVKFKLPQVDVRTFAYEHINKWLASYGDHMTRPANQLVQLGIGVDGFELAFDHVNNAFRNLAKCPFNKKLPRSNSYKATFLAKDLCLALHGISDLQLIGDIAFACSNDALVLSYATDVADYTVVVPTTKGKRRNDEAFYVYEGVPAAKVAPPTDEDSNVEDELMFEKALALSNAVLTDDEIERICGLDVAGGDELLDDWSTQPYEEKDLEWTVSSDS